MRWSALNAAVVLTLIGSCTSASSVVDPKKCRVWGSGTNANVDTPARYVHIAVFTKDNLPITKSLGKGVFKVEAYLTMANGKKSKLKVNEFDRGDGTYSFQYYFTSPGTALVVKVEHVATKKHVGLSPYKFSGSILSEKCNCPREPAVFKSDYQCGGSDPAGQIDLDMAKHPNGVTREMMEFAVEEMNKNETSLIHFSIIDNKVYSKNYGKYGGFQKFFNEILFSLMWKVKLPDMEFLLNMGDWPSAPKFDDKGNPIVPYPMFSWCSSENHNDMLFPTYKIVQATVFGKDVENVQEVDGKSFEDGGAWDSKANRVYFRGRPSNAVRTSLMHEFDNNDQMDIMITRNHFNYFPNEAAKVEHREWEKKHGSKVDREKFSSAFKNKYQLNIDGTVAAYRLPALIAGNSAVIKQESDYYEHFYKAMVPWKHYVPINRLGTDLKEKVAWLEANDAKAFEISTNARKLARNHLRVEDIYCYHLLALERFAAMQKFNPEIHTGMTLQQDPEVKTCTCPKRDSKPRVRAKLKRQGPKHWEEL